MLTLWNQPNARRFDALARSLFQDAFHRIPAQRHHNIPPTRVTEEAEGLVLRSELPGYSPDDLDVTFEDGVLTLRGSHNHRPESDGDEPVSAEEEVTFTRSYRVPAKVDPEGIRATLRRGVLTVQLPWAEASEPRSIAIDVG